VTLLLKCEVCGREADIHHIIHKSEGGMDLSINYKALCEKHHRGKDGPHRDRVTDIQYKIELQNKLEDMLTKDFYTLNELISIFELNHNKAKKFVNEFRICKEGYKKRDIIFWLLGRKIYEEYMLDDFEDFWVVNVAMVNS
jgi:hypothetical protein